jgi:hypothetical protein
VSPDNVEHLGLYKPRFISGVLTRQSLGWHYCQQLTRFGLPEVHHLS